MKENLAQCQCCGNLFNGRGLIDICESCRDNEKYAVDVQTLEDQRRKDFMEDERKREHL